MRGGWHLIAATWLAATPGWAESLIVNNRAGSVSVVVEPGIRISVSGAESDGAASADAFEIVRNGDDIIVDIPKRDERLDLSVRLPLGVSLSATTGDGDISVDGMVHLLRLRTDTGALRLRAPLRGIRLRLDAETAPSDFDNPAPRVFRESRISRGKGTEISAGRAARTWRLSDRLPEHAISYGDYWITAKAPRSVELAEFRPPAGWPLRFPWEAERELTETLAPPRRGARTATGESGPAAANGEGDLVFRSDVRMVNLTVAVTDEEANPAAHLAASNFRLAEDGAVQQLAVMQSGDAAFNLALVLDMSGSAELHREPIQAAARRFVEMARPGDRMAIYALTYGMFQVVAPLSDDHASLLEAVENLPSINGASPLYDIVTLAYAHELRQLPGDRNAIILISDGLDNQITGGTGPSEVRFRQLTRMAEVMHSIIYPVYLEEQPRGAGPTAPTGRFLQSPRQARRAQVNARVSRRRLSQLARTTGGRLFPARSINDLEPIFPQIEAELRSVYTLGYYPTDQEFDGDWRTIQVSVDEPGLNVRARPGYYAR